MLTMASNLNPVPPNGDLKKYHIAEITLQQYRGLQNIHLPLNEQMNVFIGLNGAGKSSILDATAILLSWLVNRIKTPYASGKPILEIEIQNSFDYASLAILLENNNGAFSWTLIKTRKGHNPVDRSALAALNKLTGLIKDHFSANSGKINLPVFVYYPVNRAVLDIPLRIREKHLFDVLSAYDNALTGAANFRTFFEWFREREDLENENRRYLHDIPETRPAEFQFPDLQLEAVRRALTRFMPDFKNFTVRRNPLRMEVEKYGKRLIVNQLSDGEKCLMALIGDLARRLVIANPLRDDPLDGNGVVLIDEIDLHLHPEWQRRLIPGLQHVFPNCQFLVSTHSPHVITHVQPESLYLLRMTDNRIVCEQPNESYGKTVERVLEDLMGLETTRPDEVSQSLDQIYQAIDLGELDAAKQAISELQAKIGNDPDLTKANVLIKRKELIGK